MLNNLLRYAAGGGELLIQESLTNVSRHAQASQVSIRLECLAEHVLIEVSDNGKGFDPAQLPKGTLGMLGMHERGHMLGGTVTISSAPGQGACVQVNIPSQIDPESADRPARAPLGSLRLSHQGPRPRDLARGHASLRGRGLYIDAGLAEQMTFAASGLGPSNEHAALTDRELQVLRLLARGLSISSIAAELVISHKTVSTHKARLMEKMGFSCSVEIIRYAVRQQLIE